MKNYDVFGRPLEVGMNIIYIKAFGSGYIPYRAKILGFTKFKVAINSSHTSETCRYVNSNNLLILSEDGVFDEPNGGTENYTEQL